MRSARNLWKFMIVTVAFAVVGCDSGIPSGVMSIEEMIPIVKDLQIAYAGVDATMPDLEKRPPKYEEMNTLILAKHQVGKDQFFGSFSYYQEHPILMDSIFKNVVNQINQDILDLDKKGGQQPNQPAPAAK